MSRMRGVFPLLFATAFGIVNGVWVFAPAFKEQQLQKEAQTTKAVELEKPSESKQMENEVLRNAEAAASRSAATDSALKPPSSNPWWTNIGLWSKKSQAPSDQSGGGSINPKTKD